MESLSKLTKHIAAEFLVPSSLQFGCTNELFDMIYSLCSIVEEQQIGLFGEILIGLVELADISGIEFRSHLRHFHDQLSTCLLYLDRDFESRDSTKMTGRCVLKLLLTLSEKQFGLFVKWNQLVAVELAAAAVDGGFFDPNECEMSEIIRRLRGLRSEAK